VLAGGSAALAGAILSRHERSLAQGLSGSIRIGYEGANAFVGPYVEAAAQAVMTANPGATIEIAPSAGSGYLNQLAMQLFTRTAPDAFLILGIGSGELAQGGFILPLDDYLAGWDGWAQYGEQAKFGVTLQGNTWSVPWGLNVYFLYYRKDLFEAAGLPVDWQPQTREEIIAAAAAIQTSNSDVIPYSIYAGANGENSTAADFMTLILSNGGTLTDPAGKWYIDSCPIRETLGYYENAFQTAAVVPQSVLTDVAPLVTIPQYFSDGELGILHEQAKHHGIWLTEHPDNAQNIGIALFPGNDGPFALGDAGDAWYINKISQNPDLAWAFIEAFNSAETQAALAIDDPHLPARDDARADAAWQATPLAPEMLAVADALTFPPPEPQFRKLIGVVQNATSLVATGEATPVEAIERYGEELTLTMGKQNVIEQACP
jgi:multiple sugar transport system substrate-binding protein